MIGDCSLVNGTFSRKPTGSEEFLNRMVDTLGITVGRRLKKRLRKMES